MTIFFCLTLLVKAPICSASFDQLFSATDLCYQLSEKYQCPLKQNTQLWKIVVNNKVW